MAKPNTLGRSSQQQRRVVFGGREVGAVPSRTLHSVMCLLNLLAEVKQRAWRDLAPDKSWEVVEVGQLRLFPAFS